MTSSGTQVEDNNSSNRPSFVSTIDEDLSSSGSGISSMIDARRNILDDIDNSDSISVPPASQKEYLAVFLRVKPKTIEEMKFAKNNSKQIDNSEMIVIENDRQIALHPPKESQTYKNSIKGAGQIIHRSTFSKVFKPETSQEEIFSYVVCPKVKEFLEGESKLLFTYGATSSGKTYTLQGETGNSGVIPRAIDTIFSTLREALCGTVLLQPVGFNKVKAINRKQEEELRREKMSVFQLGLKLLSKKKPKPSSDVSTVSTSSSSSNTSTASGVSSSHGLDLSQLGRMFQGLSERERDLTKLDFKNNGISYCVWISFAEIYNENIFDLLKEVPETKTREKSKRNALKLSEDRQGATYIKGLREIQVTTADEAYQAFMIGKENLHFAATRLNQQSSRSHCIFTIKLISVADPNSPHVARVSTLTFCDLAGSERISKTLHVGDRQKEAGNINTSLLVLGRCMKAIRDNQGLKDKKCHQVVPFRDSKLTKLFKSFLTGLGKTSLIVCISQAHHLFDESINVCKFAATASKVIIETYKEIPPPRRVSRAISRFSTMANRNNDSLLQSSGDVIFSGKGFTSYGSSKTRTSLFNPSTKSSIVRRLSNMNNISEEVEGDDSTDNVINQEDDTRYEGLLRLVEELKRNLIEERQKNQTMEKELREELCDEFNIMLVETEMSWENRLKEDKADIVKMSKWRLNNEMQSVQRNPKKRRRDNNADNYEPENYAQSMEEERKKVAMLNKELEENRLQINIMKEATIKSQQVQEQLQIHNSKLQFELADQNRIVVGFEKEVENLKADLLKVHSVRADGEEDRHFSCKKSLAIVQKELDELSYVKEVCQDVAEQFETIRDELHKLEKVCADKDAEVNHQIIVIQDLRGQLDDSEILVYEVNNQLEDKEQHIDDLEKELGKFKAMDVCSKVTITQLNKQAKEIKDELESYTKIIKLAANKKVNDAESESNGNQAVSSLVLEECKECPGLKQEVRKLSALNDRLGKNKDSVQKQCDGQRKEIDELRSMVEMMKLRTRIGHNV